MRLVLVRVFQIMQDDCTYTGFWVDWVMMTHSKSGTPYQTPPNRPKPRAWKPSPRNFAKRNTSKAPKGPRGVFEPIFLESSFFAGANVRCLTVVFQKWSKLQRQCSLGARNAWWFSQLLKEPPPLRKEGSDDYLGIAVVQHQPFTDGFMVSVSGGSPNPEKWVPVFSLEIIRGKNVTRTNSFSIEQIWHQFQTYLQDPNSQGFIPISDHTCCHLY